MIASQVEDILRSMFQKGMLKDIPQSWSEDEVVDFMSRLNDPILSKGKIPEKGDEDLIKAPEWARALSLRLDQLTDLVPVFRRMNQERTRKAEQTAQRTRLFNLDTDEEKDLLAEEEKTPPTKEYPLEPKEQFHDYTQDNSDLTMRSGTKRREGERGPVQTNPGSEELKRKLFNQLMDAQKRENESLEAERTIKSLPGRIEDLVRKLINTPFNKWSTSDMIDIEKYLTPEQATQLSDMAQERTEKRVKRSIQDLL